MKRIFLSLVLFLLLVLPFSVGRQAKMMQDWVSTETPQKRSAPEDECVVRPEEISKLSKEVRKCPDLRRLLQV